MNVLKKKLKNCAKKCGEKCTKMHILKILKICKICEKHVKKCETHFLPCKLVVCNQGFP